jgi:hypothetical protein
LHGAAHNQHSFTQQQCHPSTLFADRSLLFDHLVSHNNASFDVAADSRQPFPQHGRYLQHPRERGEIREREPCVLPLPLCLIAA